MLNCCFKSTKTIKEQNCLEKNITCAGGWLNEKADNNEKLKPLINAIFEVTQTILPSIFAIFSSFAFAALASTIVVLGFSKISLTWKITFCALFVIFNFATVGFLGFFASKKVYDYTRLFKNYEYETLKGLNEDTRDSFIIEVSNNCSIINVIPIISSLVPSMLQMLGFFIGIALIYTKLSSHSKFVKISTIAGSIITLTVLNPFVLGCRFIKCVVPTRDREMY